MLYTGDPNASDAAYYGALDQSLYGAHLYMHDMAKANMAMLKFVAGAVGIGAIGSISARHFVASQPLNSTRSGASDVSSVARTLSRMVKTRFGVSPSRNILTRIVNQNAKIVKAIVKGDIKSEALKSGVKGGVGALAIFETGAAAWSAYDSSVHQAPLDIDADPYGETPMK